MSLAFEVAKSPYLVAVSDGTRMRVFRSLAVSVDSPAYHEVADYIREQGFVLIDTKTETHEPMLGWVEKSHWGTPEARLLWLSTEEEEN